MSIDLPFSAFALESCAAPSPAPGEVPTLTLQLALASARSTSLIEPMSGTMSTDLAFSVLPNAERAAVLAADASPLTITF